MALIGLQIKPNKMAQFRTALLERNDLLQNQVGLVLGGQIGSKVCHHPAGLSLADVTEDPVALSPFSAVTRVLTCSYTPASTRYSAGSGPPVPAGRRSLKTQ